MSIASPLGGDTRDPGAPTINAKNIDGKTYCQICEGGPTAKEKKWRLNDSSVPQTSKCAKTNQISEFYTYLL
jgi:hypothetical protein